MPNIIQDTYTLSFQQSPIIFTGGIANLVGGMLPIIAITQALNFTEGLLQGAVDLSADNAFANFYPMPGSKLARNAYGEYPFANQSVAANARIAEPLIISLRMEVPASPANPFASKLAIMTALKLAIDNHCAQGGTFTVATPSYLYTSCVLLDLTDISGGQPSQPQRTYQWDFRQPLLTEAAAIQAFNGMMGLIGNGLPSTGALSGPEVSSLPQSLTGSSVVAGQSNLAGSSVSGFGGNLADIPF